MPKRDPEKTARNKIIKVLSAELEILLPQVLDKTKFRNELSLHAKIGSKHAEYIDIKHEVISSPEHFISLWLEGFEKKIAELNAYSANSFAQETYALLKKHKVFRDYLYIFLKRTYLRHYESLSKRRPSVEEAEIWIGQENASYGILVSPRFVNGEWENDKSEIRRFDKPYFSIGHILKTGLVIPSKNEVIPFTDVKAYLNFFKNVLVRNSGSKYEMEIAEQYCAYVLNHSNPENIPLLIPEYRYDGILKKHRYRLDFTIIEPQSFNKIGFELSPWSSHGYLIKTKAMTQKDLNDAASSNFEREMKKHKDFFKRHGIFALIYTDSDLQDTTIIFNDMLKYLEAKTFGSQLKFHILDEFFG